MRLFDSFSGWIQKACPTISCDKQYPILIFDYQATKNV